MARFTNLQMTNQGKIALAESTASREPFIIGVDDPGYIEIGDGFMPSGATRETMTELVSPRIRATITGRSFRNGQVVISARVNNADVTEDIFIREIGIPAKLQGGTPLLFGYDNATDGAGILPKDGGSGFVSHEFQIPLIIGNASNVIINIDSSARLNQFIDEFITTDGQQIFTPTNVDPYGGFLVVVEGAVAFGWTVENQEIRLSAPLPEGRRVQLIEFRGGA